MKSIEQKHSEILVGLMENTKNSRDLVPNFRIAKKQYQEVAPEKSYSDNPFIDEICSGRLLNLIGDYFYQNNYKAYQDMSEIRVSDLPTFEEMKTLKKGFGPRCQMEYQDILNKYNQNK